MTATTTATQTWSAWDPADSPAPPGCCSMRGLADDLVEAGRLDQEAASDFVETVHAAAREGRFELSLTMHAVVATRRPARRDGRVDR